MKKIAATAVVLLSMFGGTVAAAGAASAAPPNKCVTNPENVQVVNGQCVSDGKAQHL